MRRICGKIHKSTPLQNTKSHDFKKGFQSESENQSIEKTHNNHLEAASSRSGDLITGSKCMKYLSKTIKWPDVTSSFYETFEANFSFESVCKCAHNLGSWCYLYFVFVFVLFVNVSVGVHIVLMVGMRRHNWLEECEGRHLIRAMCVRCKKYIHQLQTQIQIRNTNTITINKIHV